MSGLDYNFYTSLIQVLAHCASTKGFLTTFVDVLAIWTALCVLPEAICRIINGMVNIHRVKFGWMTLKSLWKLRKLFGLVPGYGEHTKASSSSNGVCRVTCISQKNNVFQSSIKEFMIIIGSNTKVCDLFSNSDIMVTCILLFVWLNIMWFNEIPLVWLKDAKLLQWYYYVEMTVCISVATGLNHITNGPICSQVFISCLIPPNLSKIPTDDCRVLHTLY